MIDTRKITKEYRLSHWTQIMQERVESGLSIKGYCEREGIHQNVYHYWQRKLRAMAITASNANNNNVSTPNECIPASPPQGWALCSPSPKAISEMSGQIQIEIGKSRVTANTGTNLDLLCEVCRMLMTLC